MASIIVFAKYTIPLCSEISRFSLAHQRLRTPFTYIYVRKRPNQALAPAAGLGGGNSMKRIAATLQCRAIGAILVAGEIQL